MTDIPISFYDRKADFFHHDVLSLARTLNDKSILALEFGHKLGYAILVLSEQFIVGLHVLSNPTLQ